MKLDKFSNENYADINFQLSNKENYHSNPAKENYKNLVLEINCMTTKEQIIDYEALNKLLEPLLMEFKEQEIKSKEIDKILEDFVNVESEKKFIEIFNELNN